MKGTFIHMETSIICYYNHRCTFQSVVPSLLCFHTHLALFWLRKASGIVETYQLSFRLFMCMLFIRKCLHFFGTSFLFLFPNFILISAGWYLPEYQCYRHSERKKYWRTCKSHIQDNSHGQEPRVSVH